MTDIRVRFGGQPISVSIAGARGPMGPASGPLGLGSVTAETVSNDSGEQAAIRDKIGAAGAAVEDGLAALGTVTGLSGNAPNVRQFPDHNFLSTAANASAVMAGTVDQPNVVGGRVYQTSFTGNGSQASFVVSPGFTVDSAAYRNILVYLVTRGTRAEVLQNEGVHYSVSGKGTGTITITMNSAPTAEQDLRVRVYRKENSSYSPLLNYAGYGYDNANDGSGSMTIQFGAHHVNVGNTGGHNSFLGGANSIMRGGTSYSAALGLSHDFNGALSGFAAGMRHQLSGSAPSALGASNKAGNWALALGELTEAESPYSLSMGRRGKARLAGEIAMGCGAAADSSSGMMTVHRSVVRRVLTSTSNTSMLPPTGSAVFVMDDNSTAFARAVVHLVEPATGDFRVLEVIGTCHRGEGAETATMVGASAFEEIQKSSGLSPSGGHWEALFVHSAGNGGFGLFGKGSTGKTIQALAMVDILYINHGAASV